MSNQTKDKYLNCLINPTFTNANRLFVLSFANDDDDDLVLVNIIHQRFKRRLQCNN